MNVRYKRELRHNYLILDAREKSEGRFEIRMLEGNTIEGLLRFRVKEEEQSRDYYYEITSKQPLSRILEYKNIKKEELGKLIIGIGRALHHMESYLLQESDVLLEPEYIYIEPETYQVWLCYVPGYQGDFPAAMGKLLQFLLKKADHKDNDTVVLAYRLYQESQKDYYGIDDLLKAVQESQAGDIKEFAPYREGSADPALETKEGNWLSVRKDIRNGSAKGLNWESSNPEESWPNEETEEETWGRKSTSGFSAERSIFSDKAAEEKNRESKSTDKEGKKRGRGRIKKHQKKNGIFVLTFLIFLIAVPLGTWLYLGTAGLTQYQNQIIGADIGGAAIFLMVLIREKKEKERPKKEKRDTKKNQTDSREKWYMEFEEEEEGKRNADTEAAEEEIQPSFYPESKGNHTVLLAETKMPEEMSHLLKSLDPSIEDISISYFPFLIGKQEGIVDYVLKKDTVSRLHVRIDEEKGSCRITDLNSSNGTIVAGHSLEANESYLVSSGDKIQIADISFVFY